LTVNPERMQANIAVEGDIGSAEALVDRALAHYRESAA
jgi:hypothetical protein